MPNSEKIIDSPYLRTPEKVSGGLRADYFSDPSDLAQAPARAREMVSRPATVFDSANNRSFVQAGSAHTTVITHTSLNSDLNKIAPTEAKTHGTEVTVGPKTYEIVPVPIEMFDSREGVSNMDFPETGPGGLNDIYKVNYEYIKVPIEYANVSTVAWNGVMSMVDIDMGNLSAFLRGDFNSNFPLYTTYANNNGGPFSVSNATVPNIRGRLIYISDRRGDRDFDGEFDMEDIYGPKATACDNTKQPGEDANGDGLLQNDYEWEGAKIPARHSRRLGDSNSAFSSGPGKNLGYHSRSRRCVRPQVLPARGAPDQWPVVVWYFPGGNHRCFRERCVYQG
ncbi:MAG: hypothetical protein WKF84_29515 [Pyrinomonadaceae bacterium]